MLTQRIRGDLPTGIQGTFVAVGVVFFGFAVLLAVGLFLVDVPRGDVKFTPPDGVSAFALFFLAAVVVERILEPFSSYLVRAKEEDVKSTLGTTKAAAQNSVNASSDEEAKKQAATTENQAVKNGAFVVWGAATALSVMIAYLLALSMPAALGITGVDPAADLFVTAIIIGAGSKPLHDLVSLIQKSSQAADKAV